jgi:arabinoxylan arabinofuranohydrolase
MRMPVNKIIFIALYIAFFSGYAQKRFSGGAEGVAYLFVYFTGNAVADESIHYAVSSDGLNFFALNNNEPVLDSKSISSTGGVRDPHILRSNDGKTFYMVVTDMTSSKGWNSNRAMVLMKSSDLVHWQSKVINIQQRFSKQDSLLRVWAPQTIYDSQAKKYMIYWSMKHGRKGEDIIYYAYANEAFTDLETEPKQLFFPGNGKSCIDGDIVLKDGVYHLFYKTEGHGNGIRKATSASLTSGRWSEHEGYLQQTNDAVEGACVFKLHNSTQYILMYDVYTRGRYEFTQSETLDSFTLVDSVSMDFHPRHGAVISITREELNRLWKQWGRPARFVE